MRYSLQYCQVLNNITVATKIKPKILQNFTHPLYYLLQLIEWQRILYRVNLVGLAQGLPQKATCRPPTATALFQPTFTHLVPLFLSK